MCKKDYKQIIYTLLYHLSVRIFHEMIKCIQPSCVIMLEKHGHCVGEPSRPTLR